MARVFLISAIVGEDGDANEQVNVLLRHLTDRGNEVTLFGKFSFCLFSFSVTVCAIFIQAFSVFVISRRDVVQSNIRML